MMPDDVTSHTHTHTHARTHTHTHTHCVIATSAGILHEGTL